MRAPRWTKLLALSTWILAASPAFAEPVRYVIPAPGVV